MSLGERCPTGLSVARRRRRAQVNVQKLELNVAALHSSGVIIGHFLYDVTSKSL